MTRHFLPLADVFGDEEIVELFCERAFVESWLTVERALAQAQGELGAIPVEAAAAIRQQAIADKVDLDLLRSESRVVGYPILPLIEQISARSTAEVGAYIHWGATTQDVMDTGLVLILDRALALIDRRRAELIEVLAALAQEHRHTVLAARTHGQQAVPTTFGAKLAVWLDELCRHGERVEVARTRSVRVQLFGAAGTAAGLGQTSSEIRARVAELLAIGGATVPWHTARDTFSEVAFVAAAVAATCGKIAREVIELSRTEIRELSEATDPSRGASSTMPQKANPILSETIVGLSALARQLVPPMLEAMQGSHERSAGEWQIEWDALPTVLRLSASALTTTTTMVRGLQVFPQRMTANLTADGGMLMAEAVMFAIAPKIGRLNAHHLVYDACRTAREREQDLGEALAEALGPELVADLPPLETLLDPAAYLGEVDSIIDAALAATEAERIST